MKALSSKEILEKYLNFFIKQGHKQVPNVSLVPEGDSTLLFVNSGMFPLVPYLSGQPHPLGNRLVNVQRSIRFEDIEDIGDNRHTTGFHMLGNWSLGDYFKKEQLNWVYTLLVEELGLDINRLYASVFEGDENAPKDEESISILKNIFNKYGIKAEIGERIFLYGKEDNWWQRGEAVGELGGPDSEIYYYIGTNGTGLGKNPADFQDEFLEIGNSVFMQYRKTENGWEELPQKNVDFGGGLERIALIVQNKQDIFETDGFFPIIQKIEELSGLKYTENKETMRIVADHMRSAILLAMDNIKPANKDQGYILRKLIRRMVRAGMQLNIYKNISAILTETVINLPIFKELYPSLADNKAEIEAIFSQEEEKFRKTLSRAEKEVQTLMAKLETKTLNLNEKELALEAFNLYQSHGYPIEMFLDDLKNSNISFNKNSLIELFERAINEHQEISRQGAEQKFKGGLADSSEKVIKYHTATHLLQKALKEVLGNDVSQKGSNNTKERLRFDFNFERALTNAEINKIEEIVNSKIKESLPVQKIELNKSKALKTGAYHISTVDYPEKVIVYYFGDKLENAWSKEFCGGPHVENTSQLGKFKIIKEESAAKGIRRIKAILE